MHEFERRQALARFLRQQRDGLSPGDVGLPAGMRRRTPGLRREEVAQLANIGTSWYIWLEQGRNVHPSVEVLESLAQALKLTANERRHLFLLAGQLMPPAASLLEEIASPALRQMLDDLHPTPAYVLGRRYDYLAWNQAADRLFRLSESTARYQRNLVWRIFHNPEMRQRPTWEQLARGTLSEFRATHARYPDDESFHVLIEDLKQSSPDFCRWWPHHDVRKALDAHKEILHPTLGSLSFEHLILQVLSSPDIRIMIYTPDQATREKLHSLLALTPEQFETNASIQQV